MTRAAGDEVAAIIQSFRTELHDPAQPLALLVRFEVDDADGEKVVAAFAAAKPLTLKEPGCIAFHLNRHPRDPGRFAVYEQWRNLADLEAHLRTDYILKLRAELDILIVGAPEFQVLLPAAGRAEPVAA
jgi:quinol monooxygenase YgiN